MRIMITDQSIEDHVIKQSQHMWRTRSGNPSNKIKALRQTWTTFVLVFHLRNDA